jgi:putative acetyltransferase
MDIEVRALSIDQCEQVLRFWSACEGIGLGESDTNDGLARYLRRNPEMSAVAVEGQRIVGAVLCGHDARRGYLHHLAVEPSHRRRGIARRLLQHCFEHLAAVGVPKCNIFLFADNDSGATFWLRAGWLPREDLRVLQKPVPTQ